MNYFRLVQVGEDADLVKAKRVQKEKPFHFTGMSDVKSKWEHVDVDQSAKDERREERKQEIQSIRNRLFMVSDLLNILVSLRFQRSGLSNYLLIYEQLQNEINGH